MPDLDEHTPEEIAEGTREFVMFLEEADSMECVYTWRALMEGTVIEHDFRDQGS